MKKILVIAVLTVIMVIGMSTSADAQVVVNSVDVEKIIVSDGDVKIEWDASKLTNEQINALLELGKATVLVDGFTYKQKQEIASHSFQNVIHKEDLNETAAKGLHLELETFFSPFNMYGVTSSGTAAGHIYGKLENVNTYAINAALVHQFKGEVDLYIGGGTGFVSGQLHWRSDVGSESTNSFVLPVFVRVGALSPISRKVSGFLNADLGVGIGLEKAKTALHGNLQMGIYYGSTKIALSFLAFKPDSEYFFKEDLNNKFGGGFGLTVGVRI